MADIIDGVTIRMGGREFVVPPMNFRLYRQIKPKIERISQFNAKALTDENMDTVVDVIQAVLARNYPDITRDELEDLVDFVNVQPVLFAIMGVSGLERPAGEV